MFICNYLAKLRTRGTSFGRLKPTRKISPTEMKSHGKKFWKKFPWDLFPREKICSVCKDFYCSNISAPGYKRHSEWACDRSIVCTSLFNNVTLYRMTLIQHKKISELEVPFLFYMNDYNLIINRTLQFWHKYCLI